MHIRTIQQLPEKSPARPAHIRLTKHACQRIRQRLGKTSSFHDHKQRVARAINRHPSYFVYTDLESIREGVLIYKTRKISLGHRTLYVVITAYIR